MTDVLILDSLRFDDWSTPETIPFGGRQEMVVHKLPGGSRVIQTLGPDEMDITWQGKLYGDNADNFASQLDSLRKSGREVALSYTGRFYKVVVSSLRVDWIRFPMIASYAIVCTVSSAPMSGNLSASSSTFADLVSADLASALSVLGF